MPKKVLIIGAGFGGISAALAFTRHRKPNLKVTLVSARPHFEYHAALYRVVTGKSPLEVCIPLDTIFKNKPVELIVDTIEEIDVSKKTARGISGSHYTFDYLILGLGAETAYFNVPGLKEFSFGFKSITEALHLKNHLHGLLEATKISDTDKEEDMTRLHVVVVGAGASGVELAGELRAYLTKIAKIHKVDERLITVDLIEGAPRVLPALPEKVSKKVETQLRHLGVNIFTNRSMEKEEVEEISLQGLKMKTSTVIWTAGIKPNSLYSKIPGLSFDKKGRVIVDEFLQTKGLENIFVIGDGATTKYSGMAQTAVRDGAQAAENVLLHQGGKSMRQYVAKKPYYSVPVGPGWAATILGKITVYGNIGWFFRRAADLRYFLSILPLPKAIIVWRSGKKLSESCDICAPKN